MTSIGAQNFCRDLLLGHPGVIFRLSWVIQVDLTLYHFAFAGRWPPGFYCQASALYNFINLGVKLGLDKKDQAYGLAKVQGCILRYCTISVQAYFVEVSSTGFFA